MTFKKTFLYIVILSFLYTSCGSTQTFLKSNQSQSQVQKQKIVASTYTQNSIPESKVTPIKEPEVPSTSIETPSVPSYEIITIPYSLSDEIVNIAKENIGVRYRMGGTTSSGMDCSGLVYSTYQKKDLLLPRTSIAMSNSGIKISKDQAQPGDLIFFRTNGRKSINHVGIITDINDGIKFIHASIHGGVIISSLNEAYYQRAFVQINRVIE